MKQRKRLRQLWGSMLIIAMLLTLILPVCAEPAETWEATSYVQNGSFETYRSVAEWNKPADWTITGDIAAAYLNWPTGGGYDGDVVLSVYAAEVHQVTVSQTVTGLEPGYYALTAYAQNGGGQTACYLYGSGSGQSRSMTQIPAKDDWTQITVRGIQVGADGKAEIGLYVDGNANNWMNLDSVELHREKNQTTQYRLLKGGDISMLHYIEDCGGIYYDENGTAGDALQILADNGWNIVRLRLYNNPGKGRGDGTYYCSEKYETEEDLLKLAKRAKEKGMQIEYSFHYSDYWTNGATQIIPSEWQPQLEGLSDSEAVEKLEGLVYSYTKQVLTNLKNQGTTPEYVSFGNEMQSGILFPYGKTTNDCWPNLARFLNAAYRAAQEVDPSIRVILHLDDAGNEWKYNNFFDSCKKYGVNYDIIGASYYPYWTYLDVDTIVASFNALVDRFDKDIIVMETGFNYAKLLPDGQIGQLHHNGPYGADTSEEMQREFMIELFNGLKSVRDGRCIGDLYWDPIMIEQEGVGWAYFEETDEVDLNAISNATLFDFDHELLPVMDAYRYNTEGERETGYLSGKLADADGNGVPNAAAAVTLGGTQYHVTTDAFGTFYMAVPAGTYAPSVTVEGLTWNGTPASVQIERGKAAKAVFTMTGASISGTVTDGTTGLPNARITAVCGGASYHTATAADGTYAFPCLPAGHPK